MNKTQRIVHGQGASNITYSTIVFNFDVCWLSLPVSFTNYVHSKVICAADELPKDACHIPPPTGQGVLASHAGVFRGAGISSLPTGGTKYKCP